MRGREGIRIQTVEDGWVRVFLIVDHFDAGCLGIHAVNIGNRFAALLPIAKCRVPDDCIDARRHALFVSREAMRDLIDCLRSPQP